LRAPDLKADSIAQKSQLIKSIIKTDKFDLISFHNKQNLENNLLIIYIEGDGNSWKSKYRISEDPTPENPVALKLAAIDPRPNVFYLARPCQYLDKTGLQKCSPIYWSSHRYSIDVVNAINQAISSIKSSNNASKIELVGFSGGGVLAMLVAAIRDDVSKIITIASNIDHVPWSKYHNVSLLEGSLNPVDFINDLKNIQQLHLWGEKDRLVPVKTQATFINSLEKNKLFEYRILPEFTHTCCWGDYWADALRL